MASEEHHGEDSRTGTKNMMEGRLRDYFERKLHAIQKPYILNQNTFFGFSNRQLLSKFRKSWPSRVMDQEPC